MNKVMIEGSGAGMAEYEWDRVDHTGARTGRSKSYF
jgi:hypothetical protein